MAVSDIPTVPSWIEEERYRPYFDYFPNLSNDERVDGMLAFMKFIWNTSDDDPEDTWNWSINVPVECAPVSDKLTEWRDKWHEVLTKYYALERKGYDGNIFSSIKKYQDEYILHIEDPEQLLDDGDILYDSLLNESEAKEYLGLIFPCKPDNRLHFKVKC